MENIDLKSIGTRILNRRKQQGLTQEQLAEKMNVSIQMISNLERGNKAIRIENLINLSQILGVSADYILTGKETDNDVDAFASLISKLSPPDRKMIEILVDFCLSKECSP